MPDYEGEIFALVSFAGTEGKFEGMRNGKNVKKKSEKKEALETIRYLEIQIEKLEKEKRRLQRLVEELELRGDFEYISLDELFV